MKNRNVGHGRKDGTLKQRAIETAAGMFVDAGYNGISMREISESLGVSKAALYYHFKDKQDLMVAILESYLERMESLFESDISQGRNCREQITRLVTLIFAQPPQQRAVMRLASQEMGNLDPEVREEFGRTYHRKFIRRIKSILQTGVSRGEIKLMDTASATWVLLGMMYPFFYPGSANSERDATRLVDQILTIFFDGADSRARRQDPGA